MERFLRLAGTITSPVAFAHAGDQMLESAQVETGSSLRKRAAAIVTVNHHESDCYDRVGGADLVELRLRETFSGEMNGESQVRALQVINGDQSVTQLSLQTFHGNLHGRRGSFLLQGTGTVQGGWIRAKWTVVPASGTGELSGLRGEGGFEGEFGKGSVAILEYWFD